MCWAFRANWAAKMRCQKNVPVHRAAREFKVRRRVGGPRRNGRPQLSSARYKRPAVSREGGVGKARAQRGGPAKAGTPTVNQKKSRESILRRLESTKQMYT